MGDTTKQILVVDDDSAVRNGLVRVLMDEGYSAWPASSGSEALAMASAVHPDLVILDLNLPGQSGWDLFRSLVRWDPTLATVVITGEANQLGNAHAAGAGAFFEKPIDYPAFLEAVSALLPATKSL